MENNENKQEQTIKIGDAEQAFINKNVLKEEPVKEEVKEEPKVEKIQLETSETKEETKEEEEDDGLTVGVDVSMENVKQVTTKDTNTEKSKDPNYVGEINFPSTTYSKYAEFFRNVPQSQAGIQEYVAKLPQDTAATFALNTLADGSTIVNDVLVDSFKNKDNEFVNTIEFGGKKLQTRPISIKTNTKLTQESSVARIYALLGVGEVVQVPLWHSGFWITIKPIKQKDFINLYNSLSSQTTKLGRETNSLIYSNYSVVFIRILVEFILAHITEHTIKINDDETILDYIKVQDLYPMVNGLLAAMYPRGIDIVKCCVNSTKLDPENNKPLCDYSLTAKVDSKKLLWVNRRALDKYMISQMSKRTSASVSTSEVKEYQNRVKKNQVDIESTSMSGIKIRLTLKTPNLREYIDQGEKWVNDLISDVEKLYTPQDTDSEKISKLTDAILTSRLNTYNGYIDKVTFIASDNTETTFDTSDGVREALDTISNDQDLFLDIIKKIGEFYTNNSIAIVATPNFVCPKCNSSQEDGSQNKTFTEFIPLNVIDNFFVLGGLRKQSILTKGAW